MDFNFFNEEEKPLESYLGFGKSGTSVLEPSEERAFYVSYTLGALEKDSEIRMAPYPEKLELLLANAHEATLVIEVK